MIAAETFIGLKKKSKLTIVIDCTYKEFGKFCKINLPPLPKNKNKLLEGIAPKLEPLKRGASPIYYLWINPKAKSSFEAVLAHELLHLCMDIFRWEGKPLESRRPIQAGVYDAQEEAFVTFFSETFDYVLENLNAAR